MGSILRKDIQISFFIFNISILKIIRRVWHAYWNNNLQLQKPKPIKRPTYELKRRKHRGDLPGRSQCKIFL